MSSGTQIDLDWAGLDVGQGGAVAPPVSVPDATGFSGAGNLTDEEILGIEPSGKTTASNRDVIPFTGNVHGELSEEGNPSSIDSSEDGNLRRDSSGENRSRNDGENTSARGVSAAAETGAAGMPAWMQMLAGDPTHGAEAQQLWQEHQAFRASFSSPAEARAIKEMFPGGAQEAQSLKQASQSVDRIDAAIFSGDARAQSEVVAELARANPAAFRSLFAEAARVLAGAGGGDDAVARLFTGGEVAPTSVNTPGSKDPGYSNAPSPKDGLGRQAPATNYSSSVATDSGRATNHPSQELRAGESRVTNHESQITNHAFDPVAYSSFERNTNDVVARDVRSTIGDTLARVLPEGVADGAARRIGEDIFNEVHRALAADRSLSEQVGQALRAPVAAGQGWRFGSAEQQRVASLLAGRAKQLVPSVARRVIGEWTSSVLGTARSKAARQAVAASRVDIAAAGGSLDSMPLRAMSPREVNYTSMSDDEILGL